MEKIKIKVAIPDMQNDHCQKRVKNVIEAIEGAGVNSIQPGTVEIDIQVAAQQERIVTAIENAGYTVAGIETLEKIPATDWESEF